MNQDPGSDVTNEEAGSKEQDLRSRFLSSPRTGAVSPYLILLAVTSPLALLGKDKIVIFVLTVCVMSAGVVRRWIKTGWGSESDFGFIPLTPTFESEFRAHSLSLAGAAVLAVVGLFLGRDK